MTQDYDANRKRMVEEQIISRGISSPIVLTAMRNVPRHLFMPEELRHLAYDDSAMQIGYGQTISQPYIVAYMTERLEPYPGMKILEIGTGSGYQAAVLAYIGCVVHTIEYITELADRAKELLAALSCTNVRIKQGNGFEGWLEEAPFDAIIVTAAPERIPQNLIEQLCDGGRMIIPVGEVNSVQSLKLLTKNSSATYERDLLLVRFVPMVDA